MRSAQAPPTPSAREVPVGALLRQWRAARRLSQLDLALEAGVSARHLSCVETGRAQASRDLIRKLADTLAIPLRERNALLLAAGYSPEYPEAALDATELGPVRRALDLVLAHQEPYPAFVLNRYWDVLDSNQAARRVNGFLCSGASRHANMLRQFFDPADLRATVANWEEVAGDLVRHLHDRIAASPFDDRSRTLLREMLAYPGVPARWAHRELGGAAPPLLTVAFRRDATELRFFSTIATFGTPRDVTLDELSIECAFPADEGTAEFCRTLAAG
jgi:transcriptional regulator with XRE-family HTH domain